jgi:hypothetical protein
VEEEDVAGAADAARATDAADEPVTVGARERDGDKRLPNDLAPKEELI